MTGSSAAASSGHASPDHRARRRARRKGDGAPLVMVTAYDAPSARVVDAAGVDMILVGDSLAMVVLGYDDTLQVTTDDMVHHVGAVARTQAAAAGRRRPAVAQLPRVARGDGPQRGRARARRRRRGEARRRPQAARRGRRDPRRRDPGDGPPRPHPAVDPRARRLPGAGQAARRRPGRSSTTRSRSPRPGASRSCSSASPTASPGWSPTRSTSRRSGSAPAGTATARCSCTTTCSASRTGSCPKFVRRYADLRRRRPPTAVAQLRRRRPGRDVPVERRDVPHDRSDGEAFDLYARARRRGSCPTRPGSVHPR